MQMKGHEMDYGQQKTKKKTECSNKKSNWKN